MNHNTGQAPITAGALIDIQFRNGQIKRDVKAEQYRWKPWNWGESDWDIVRWQYSAAAAQQRDMAA